MDFEDKVEWAARVVAEVAYRRAQPAATVQQARVWAGDHWPRFIRRAMNILAVREAWREAREAAPWN
jgi:hypothetical protein